MSKIEQYLKELELPFEKGGEDTWIVQPRTAILTRIGICLNDPIVTFTVNVANVGKDMKNFTKIDTHSLLWWNAEKMLHAAYGYVNGSIVLTGALEFSNLDLNEFKGMIDDISIGIDSHFEIIRSWVPQGQERAA